MSVPIDLPCTCTCTCTCTCMYAVNMHLLLTKQSLFFVQFRIFPEHVTDGLERGELHLNPSVIVVL